MIRCELNLVLDANAATTDQQPSEHVIDGLFCSKRQKIRPAGLLPPGCAENLLRSFALKHANHRLSFWNEVSDHEALIAVSHHPHHHL
jgi:hypothetical protein